MHLLFLAIITVVIALNPHITQAASDSNQIKDRVLEEAAQRKAAKEATKTQVTIEDLDDSPPTASSAASPTAHPDLEENLAGVAELEEAQAEQQAPEPAANQVDESKLAPDGKDVWHQEVLWSGLAGRVRLRRINDVLYLSLRLQPQPGF